MHDDETATEEEKSEAAGLLAQVTSPWIENNCSIEGLSRHLDNLISSLTGNEGKIKNIINHFTYHYIITFLNQYRHLQILSNPFFSFM